ncbi:MAG: ABC transporter permease, partial [Gemmataceae bacterium]
MNLATGLRTIRWMLRDTLRQSLSTRLFWVMTAVAVVFTAFCFSIDVRGDMAKSNLDYDPNIFIPKSEVERLGADKVQDDGIRVVSGEVSLGFGMVTLPVGRHREDAVRMVQVWVAGAIADTIGVLLALLWTAGFLPTFLEPQHVSVLLAKPAPRWGILL